MHRIALLTVRQFSRKDTALDKALTFYEFLRLFCGLPRPPGLNSLADDRPCNMRVELEIFRYLLIENRFNQAFHLAVSELALCLSLELRALDLYIDNGNQSFFDIVTC